MPKTFTNEWNKQRHGGVRGYVPEPYEQVLEVRVGKRRKTQRTPLSPQMKTLLDRQNLARTAAHESNLRCMDKAVEQLENWATHARYGG